jgi:bifunctional non-homologous end joining protein LigD
VSNLDKILYPEIGVKKGEVLNYYALIAEVMLPHIKDRPITLKRYPHGVNGQFFFQKHAPSNMPEWIPTVEIPAPHNDHGPVEYAMICDRPSLIWAANLASLEFHVPLWRVAKGRELPAAPDHMVFDLDPGPGTTIVECCQVARWIADRFGEENIFPKTSGSKGLQLYRPLKRMTSERASEEAHELSKAIEKDHPDAVVSLMRKELRKNKVLIDWSQNSPSKTTVACYSLRARPDATVSTPVTWDEVHKCAKSSDSNRLRFETKDVLKRVEQFGDLMEGLLPARRQLKRKAS